jgi:hypothetical protein
MKQTIQISDEYSLEVSTSQAVKGDGVTITQILLDKNQSILSKTCTVKCAGGASYSWTCSDDEDCQGDCSDPKNPTGTCYKKS